MSEVHCRYCDHPVGDHDDSHGCSYWFSKSDWENGLCGCSMTRRQLLELETNMWWFVPGMYYPVWILSGDTAHNAEADTDMGDLSVDEFHNHFPTARQLDQTTAERFLDRLPKLRQRKESL